MFAKLTFYLLYLQIFRLNDNLRWAIYIGAFVTTSFYASTTIAQFGLVTPGRGKSFASAVIGNPAVPRISYALGVFGIVTDLYILLLPIAGVLRLQIAKRRKVGVILVFLSGAL